MSLRKSTRVWLALFAAALLGIALNRFGYLRGARLVFILLAQMSCLVLLWRAAAAAFRVIVHRLTLRLAFSYFLIGIVPIPLLAALFSVCGYLLAHQFMATRLRNDLANLMELASLSGERLPSVRIGRDGRVTASQVDWLRPGDDAGWSRALEAPHPIIADGHVWMAVRHEAPAGLTLRVMPLGDPSAGWLQKLADRTGFSVAVELGRGEEWRSGYQVQIQKKGPDETPMDALRFTHPVSVASPPDNLWTREWLMGLYLDRAVVTVGPDQTEKSVVAFLARTSPSVLAGQLFAQGVPEVRRVVRFALVFLSAALLAVYLVALAIALVLVGTIVRNVNRLTRATEAVSHGNFSVRVNSKSRDQIGDLARSFDAMAASIQKLLQDTARKEKLEAELAVARAIQESFLPEAGGSWKGFRAVAHFEPAADLGGDYYDILPMPDGRTAISIGDVSGHGLPTGLVAAAARASLATFIELDVPASEAFVLLGRRTQRSRDKERRLYTTLALFAYDAVRRAGTLTNAGHPAPYRVSGGAVERLELPALPIGLLPGRPTSYASKEYAFSPGDRLVFFTDGLVEAADASEEPWGYERLETLLAREGHRPAQEIVASMLASVGAHVGDTPLEDDRTILILTFDAA